MIKLTALHDQWMKKINDPKQRLLLFLLSVLALFFIWFFLLFNPLRTSKTNLISQAKALQLEITAIQQQIATINQAVKTESVAKSMEEQRQLSSKIKHIQQQLARTKPLLISTEDWMKLKKAIISKQNDMDNSITLISINDLPVQPWAPAAVNKADVVDTVSNEIYVHELEVKLQADYFSAIQYLSLLEKLPWHVYWDSLQYKVQAYPKGDIVIKFRIFTEQKNTS